ncbi:uncharacterized protein HD556DRAFT_1310350 [Suillus plorans]|uniref:Uncharacterized protein n=1 Tax=Suillus plorans TaxID=116603 RepID=A0A9P7AJJ6_9AGAM|nr:uncharacterized protein HD556DRAFT_1310350 [Suillus plorans]KAG1790805.1 hypothetical protein HD556DRAFT_1310350 [Suillus plorans]
MLTRSAATFLILPEVPLNILLPNVFQVEKRMLEVEADEDGSDGDIRDYHATYYVPHNLSLIVTGKLSTGTKSLLAVVQDKKITKETVEFPEKDEIAGFRHSCYIPYIIACCPLEQGVHRNRVAALCGIRPTTLLVSSYIYFSEDTRATMVDLLIYIGSQPNADEHVELQQHTGPSTFSRPSPPVVKVPALDDKKALYVARQPEQASDKAKHIDNSKWWIRIVLFLCCISPGTNHSPHSDGAQHRPST